MKQSRLYLTCQLLLFFIIITPLLFSRQYPFRSYTKADGLPSPVVLCLFQDSRGFLWMGTVNGLCRFDGKEFKIYKKEEGLPVNCITAIVEDQQNRLWIGTDGGGVVYLQNDRVITPPSPIHLASQSIYAMTITRDGTVWIGTSTGLSRLDGEKFSTFTTANGLSSNIIKDLASDNSNHPWIGTKNGLNRWENGEIIDHSRSYPFIDHDILALDIDSQNRLWIGTPKGVNCVENGKCINFSTANGLTHNTTVSIMEDRQGNTWLGTQNGINIIKDNNITTIQSANGLQHNYIYCMITDQEGNTWIGTHDGVSCLKSLNVSFYAKNDGLPGNMVNSIVQDYHNHYWIGTVNGLALLHDNQISTFSTDNGLLSNCINHLTVNQKNETWISTYMGISVLSPQTNSAKNFTCKNYTVKNGLRHNVTFEIIQGHDNTMWIANLGGLHEFRNGQILPVSFKTKLPVCLSVMQDHLNHLWFSSSSLLCHWADQEPVIYSNIHGLPGANILAIFEDSHKQTWVGTEDGLCLKKNEKFIRYSIQDGLPDNTCYFITEDSNHDLWIGTEKGLARFHQNQFMIYSSPAHELEGGTWNSGILDHKGNLWFGSNHGAVSFYPPPYPVNTLPPPIHITGVKVLEKNIALESLKKLHYKQNYIRFNFTGICFSSPDRVTYRYRLQGLESQWHHTGDRSIFYPYLPPGNYQFLVSAMNNNHIESATPARIGFTIQPPFWQTWWARLIMILSGLGGLIGIISWRNRRTQEKAELKAKKQELAAKNQQLVMAQRMELMGLLASGTIHDLKNLLAVIVGYSREMNTEYASPQDNREYGEIIKSTAETAINMAKQILSFSRVKNEEPGEVDLGLLLNELLGTLAITYPRTIHTEWHLPPAPVFYPVDPARFQQVVLNLCINAVHAMPSGGTLTVVLSGTNANDIILQISDTGTGMDEEIMPHIFEPLFTTKDKEKGTGLGLFVVKQVVEEHGGRIEVKSKKGKGTDFFIRLPGPGLSRSTRPGDRQL